MIRVFQTGQELSSERKVWQTGSIPDSTRTYRSRVLTDEIWMEYFARPETFPRQAFEAKCHYMTMSMRLLPNIFGQILGTFAKERQTLLASSFLPVCRSVSLSACNSARNCRNEFW